MNAQNGSGEGSGAMLGYCAERLWEGVRFREILDDNLAIDGYWVGENGDVWSCWKKGRNAHLTDQFVLRMKPQFAESAGSKRAFLTFRGVKRGIARLVLNAFGDVDRFCNGYIAVHLNGDNTDNRLCNLRAMDLLDWYINVKGPMMPKGGGIGQKKPLDSLGLDIIKLLISGASQKAICDQLGCNHKVVMRIRRMLDEATQ
jgi:hypothetical protein